MPGTGMLIGFVAAALVVLLIPGPGVLYVLARALGQGRRAGIVSALGLSAGALVHVAAAAAGLSAVMLTSATAFSVVKMLGAGYLIYLGLRIVFAESRTVQEEGPVARTSHRLFVDGVVVSVFNPKIAVFFLAFLPQFVEPGGGPVPQQIAILGLIYVGLAIVTDSSYAILAGSLRGVFGRRVLDGPLPRYASGAVYVGLGVHTALSGRRS